MHGDERERRSVASSIDPHVGPTKDEALAALGPPVDPTIGAEEVERIASEGFPLWEPVDVMVLRNRRITLAYSILSRRLAELIAGPDGVHDANWCTFATWSSKTIGTLIEQIPTEAETEARKGRGWLGRARLGGPVGRRNHNGQHGPDGAGRGGEGLRPAGVPNRTGLLPGDDARREIVRLGRLLRYPIGRSRSSTLRAMVAGNRVVFLEVGLVMTTFLRHFEHVRDGSDEHNAHERWDACWEAIQGHLAELRMLDPSWLVTPMPSPESLRHGMQQYVKALRTSDPHRRSQLVLAGNLLLAEYEQRRVDGYIWAALALFTERAMGRFVRDRTGALPGMRRWPTGLYARCVTRRTNLELGDELLPISEPIPPPREADRWHELDTNADVTLPILQALITRYQLAVGRRPNRGATNWTSYDQRMRTIGNLFRLRQRQQSLFKDPFDEYETARLLSRRPERLTPHAAARAHRATAGNGGNGQRRA